MYPELNLDLQYSPGLVQYIMHKSVLLHIGESLVILLNREKKD
jgi:hypothetical protein